MAAKGGGGGGGGGAGGGGGGANKNGILDKVAALGRGVAGLEKAPAGCGREGGRGEGLPAPVRLSSVSPPRVGRPGSPRRPGS